MRKFALAFAALAALPLAASADVSKEDIKKLVAAGVGEDVILTFIRANGPAHKLSADDVVELKQAGASERVLGAMMGASSAAPARRVETVERVVEKQVYVPQTTYVYSTPSYYYPSVYSYGSCYPYTYYPRYSYGGYYGSYYRGYGGYRYYGPRVGVSVGWCW
jgi:hypothetical protein